MSEEPTGSVIVATDGSPAAAVAVRWAADEAVLSRRPLRVVHVQPSATFGLPDVPPPQAEEARSVEARRILDEAVAQLSTHSGLEVTTDNILGEVPRVLRELANPGDLLVLGRRGRGRFAELLLGSTSLKVAGTAKGPVVIVHGDGHGPRGEIVAAVAFDIDQTAALGFAFAEARRRGAVLRAVHAWDTGEIFSPYAETAPVVVDPANTLSELMEPWREANPDVKVAEEVVGDHPAAALSKASERADLLVLGTHHRGALGQFVFGSVGHAVLHHAHCPVAIIP
ncbi:nucleotide-binding universal stress UspA family protein [Actinocorallia herbida]|uniref:Nucleotide-binding universal stress UspA family protein n=1 Tax=Actinocorallia herbida TaxID=58109 RepID=A0A3N1D4L0_9ACTN|nr:universal stress protein [Actinocorallia herbida]ROO88483.1 nucleotide-binding universal stress UspA family protein [Actinocorallia herbida]